MRKSPSSRTSRGTYRRLFENHVQVRNPAAIEKLFLNQNYAFDLDQEDLKNIPGSPVVYWLPRQIVEMFKGPSMAEKLDSKQGLATGDNDRFMRRWFEVSLKGIGFSLKTRLMQPDQA